MTDVKMAVHFRVRSCGCEVALLTGVSRGALCWPDCMKFTRQRVTCSGATPRHNAASLSTVNALSALRACIQTLNGTAKDLVI